jgi:UDP-N-acetylglucosamine 2-epimerase (non-hydrolysing)
MRVLCVAGARPNFMKVKPVMDALERRSVETALVHTGQHYDWEMNEVFFDDLGLRAPDVWLGIGSGTHAQQTARVMESFEPVVGEMAPDVVVVVGDVNSTKACAVVAAKAGPLVAHVEAGLRSRTGRCPRRSTESSPTASATISSHRRPTPWRTSRLRDTAPTRSFWPAT